MALDTKYRPVRFDDVIGQAGAVKVLRQFVNKGSGFHQSYLFCGGHGSGKTTLGRILARALLCENPQNGDPCDACSSCRSILERGSSECFTEIDAATNSSKDDIKKITDLLHFDTFSGRRRIYLFDEAHRLSKDALDALLKPMEDTVQGSEDKLLVCIFCTTEPERMRATIFSRCAPAFVIRQVPPEGIADRLAYVCDKEGIEYEREALVCVAEAVECHIRDALKSVEGVSMLGKVSMENVKSYLRLNANNHYIRVVAYLGKDFSVVLNEIQALQEIVSPSTAYERISDLAMLAYRIGVGVGKPPSYWPVKHIQALWAVHQTFLLQIARVLASKPGHPTFAMLECDLAALHFMRQGGVSVSVPASVIPQIQAAPAVAPAPAQAPAPAPAVAPAPASASNPESEPVAAAPATQIPGRVEVTALPSSPTSSTPAAPTPTSPMVTRGGVYVDPRGINRRRESSEKRPSDDSIPPLDATEFRRGLRRLVSELTADGRGH